MKRLVLCLSLLISLATAKAQLLLNETFNYTPHATLGLAAQGSPNWAIINTGDSILIDAGSLSYSGLTASAGNKITYGGQGTDYYRGFTSQTTGTVYYSILLNVSSLGTLTATGGYTAGFLDGGTSNFIARLWIRSSGASNYNVGINPGSVAANTQWSGATLALNTTYLVVVSFQFVAGANNDVAKIWVNPSSLGGAEPAADATATNLTAPDPTTVQRYFFRQDNTSNTPATLYFDELKVGTSYADVTPVPATGASVSGSGNVSGLATVAGTASSSGSFNLTGTNLTGTGNITVSVSNTDFEVSSDNSSFGATALIPFTSPTLTATPVYVRISSSAAAGAVTANIIATGGGAGPSTVSIATGNVLAPQPTVQASNVTFSNIVDNGFDVNWTNGNGTDRIVVVRQTTAVAVPPSDGSTYTPPTTTGTGNSVVFSGSGSGPLTVTGLIAGTNYTVQVYEFNGSAGSNNYLTTAGTSNPATVTTTGISPLIQQNYFTAVSAPLYAASGSTTRLPTMFFATVSNLAPNSTYKYFVQVSGSADFGTSNTVAGNPILFDYTQSPVTYAYSNSPGFTTANNYGMFTTDANGKFTGAFGFVQTGNARFDPGNSIYPTIHITTSAGTSTLYRFALNQSITMLGFATTANPNDGSFIKGTSGASVGNVVGLWKSVDGNLVAARPLSMTLVENPTFAGLAWAGSFVSGYDQTAGSWNTIIPNVNPEGVRLIQQFDLRTGAVIGCNSDLDGTWPTGPVVTSNPSNGSTTALQISSADAPLTGGSCFAIVPIKLSSFNVQKVAATAKLSWTTQQELNSKEFVIERSKDGITWSAVGTVAAAGNSATRKDYIYTDAMPVKGINYYRLRMVDLDNRAANSETRSALFSTANDVLITPNPASSFINVYMDKTANTVSQIIISDINGKVVDKYSTTEQKKNIVTAAYAKGLYVVKVITGEQVSTQKIVIQ